MNALSLFWVSNRRHHIERSLFGKLRTVCNIFIVICIYVSAQVGVFTSLYHTLAAWPPVPSICLLLWYRKEEEEKLFSGWHFHDVRDCVRCAIEFLLMCTRIALGRRKQLCSVSLVIHRMYELENYFIGYSSRPQAYEAFCNEERLYTTRFWGFLI